MVGPIMLSPAGPLTVFIYLFILMLLSHFAIMTINSASYYCVFVIVI
jgi:hypothetical protein